LLVASLKEETFPG
jgi:hypothetical protein